MNILLVQVRAEAFAKQELEAVLKYSQLKSEQVKVVNALENNISEDMANDVDAIIFGGSGECNVSKGQPNHLDNLTSVVKTWVEKGVPFLGICYGAHVLAKALGSDVIWAEDKKETGDAVLHLKPEAHEDPLFKGLPESFHVGVGHIDAIADLPAGAVSLARTDKVDHHAFRLNTPQPVYGVQFHPELNKPEHQERIRLVYELTGDKYFKDEREFQNVIEGLYETPEASGILSRFLALIDKKA